MPKTALAQARLGKHSAEARVARISYIGDNGEPLEMVVGEENPEVMVGRHRSCGIRTATQSVSRQHARLFFDGERYWLQDNGSSNGTYYKNNRLSPQDPVEVEDGEFFMCGNFEMRFDLDEEDLQRMQAPPEGYEDTIDEVLDYGDDDEVEATRFGDASEWDDMDLQPIPPPPGAGPGIPPPPGPPIPPPPGDAYDDLPDEIEPPDFDEMPTFDPLPLQADLGGGDAHVIEDLRASLDQKDAELRECDSKIQNLEIELESLSKRLADTGQGEKLAALTAEVEQLRAVAAEVEQLRAAATEIDQLREEFEKACEDADNARDEADKALADNDDLRAQLDDSQAALAEAQAAAQQCRADAQAAQAAAAAAQQALATAPTSVVDEQALAGLKDELKEAQDHLLHAQEKYEEARAGRRNAEELAALLRTQHEMGQAARKTLEEQIAQLKASAKGAADTGDKVSKAELDIQVAALAQARSERDALSAQLASVQAELSAAVARAEAAEAKVGEAAAGGAAVAALEAELAKVKAEAVAAQKAHELALRQAGEAAANAAPVADLSADLAERDARIAELQQQLAAADQAADVADPDEIIRLNKEIEVLEADREDLERAQSANMKRIKKLLKDLDEARAQADGGGGGDNGAMQAQLDDLTAELQQARQALAAAEAAGAAAPGATDGAVADLAALKRLISNLNGVVSSFRNDFMQVSDAWEQIRGGDEGEQAEGTELMQEGLDTCTARSAELKKLVRSLRDAVND